MTISGQLKIPLNLHKAILLFRIRKAAMVSVPKRINAIFCRENDTNLVMQLTDLIIICKLVG